MVYNNMRVVLSILLFLTSTCIISAEHHVKKESKEADWVGIMRVKGLQSLDKVLALAFDGPSRSFILRNDRPSSVFQNEIDEMQLFARNFGYFSPHSPLVGKVTADHEDVKLTQRLLHLAHDHIQNAEQKQIAISEVMTKVLAYRDLSCEHELEIPVLNDSGKSELIVYKVDKIFDLWHGMPAVGLVPKKKNEQHPPILLYRGTDLSLNTERGWASVMSDLNTGGPGISVFQKSQPTIHDWLVAMAKKGPKAQVLGFSLGGVLAIYTVIFEQDWINQSPYHMSSAFNSPGVARNVLKMAKERYPKGNLPINIWITKGDLVSKIGFLIGDVRELSTKRMMKPISAHVSLVSSLSLYYVNHVDTDQENRSRGL